MSNALFASNKALFAAAFGSRIDSIDWKLVEKRRDQCLASNKPGWLPNENHICLVPKLMPGNYQVTDRYKGIVSRYRFGDGICQYLEVAEEDPHLYWGLIQLSRAVENTGFDPYIAHTTTDVIAPQIIIALGTGDGNELLSLITRYKPPCIMVAVQDWQDFATSFWTIDWGQISSNYNSSSMHDLLIGRYSTATEILATLLEVNLPGIDHALLYVPPTATEDTLKIQAELTQKFVKNSVNYLGFSLDEYNMVWHAWQSLCRQPRIFSIPRLKVSGRYVICGSGPSLDAALPMLPELAKTHQIIACASNFRSLRAAGIDVDLLVLLERGECMIDEYTETIQKYGSGNTKLVASATCPAALHDLFCDTAVYFRPALTPLAIFASSPREVLCFEGPQTINTGIALAAALQAEQVVLVGVDLGTREISRPRSKDAAGVSPRNFNLERSANFGGSVWTDQFLIDAQLSLEVCLRSNPSMKVYNTSDGLFIEGAQPIEISQYIEDSASFNDDGGKTSFSSWWDGLPRYSTQRFQAYWSSRRPRQSIASQFSLLRDLYSGPTPWFPDLQKRVTQLLSLNVAPSDQFARRIIRGPLYKLTLAITRQLHIMGRSKDQQIEFESSARRIIVDLLDILEAECYQLCDELESI